MGQPQELCAQGWQGRHSNNDLGADFKGQTRNDDTHESGTDADARLYRKGKTASDETINITLGADEGYDAKELIDACLEMGVRPHVAQNTSGRRSAVPDVLAATPGYAISQNKRKLIEQGFGWAKTVGRMRQVMVRGLKRVDQMFVLTVTAYNLTRMRTLGQIRSLTTWVAKSVEHGLAN